MPPSLRSRVKQHSPQPYPKHPATEKEPNATKNKTYLFDRMMDIPLSLRAKKFSKFAVEFIDNGSCSSSQPDSPKRDNHTMIRLTFQHEQIEASPYAPAHTKGMTLDLRPVKNQSPGSGRESRLLLKTFTYEGEHVDALHTVEIPVARNRTIGDVLRVMEQQDMIFCALNRLARALVGCRDFASQLIYHLAKAEILILPQNAVDEVWNCFNLRYGYGNQVWENPTRYAVFKASYDRVAIDGVHYVGNRVLHESVDKKSHTIDFSAVSL